MRAGTLVLLVFSAVAAVVIASSVTSADNHVVYGCFLNNGEVFWDGYGHPAAFEGFGGPYVLGAILGPECDEYPSRADYEDKRIWSPEYESTTPTPVPPTPTPVPPTPTPVPLHRRLYRRPRRCRLRYLMLAADQSGRSRRTASGTTVKRCCIATGSLPFIATRSSMAQLYVSR
jgi:hypothetical protein